MKKNNKKGFTLIELLAVIVILAILAVAAFTLVIPRINQARKDTFESEVAELSEAAKVYYTSTGQNGDQAIDICDLFSENYASTKGDVTNYGGTIKIDGNGVVSEINVYNKEYIVNVDSDNVKGKAASHNNNNNLKYCGSAANSPTEGNSTTD